MPERRILARYELEMVEYRAERLGVLLEALEAPLPDPEQAAAELADLLEMRDAFAAFPPCAWWKVAG